MTNRPGNRVSPIATFFGLVALTAIIPGLFRRKRGGQVRSEAFEEVFTVNAAIFESAAKMRPEWHEQWNARGRSPLPPRYELLDVRTVSAVYDLRFAQALLQRNRWRSIVEPIFCDDDEQAWLQFARIVAPTGGQFLSIRDKYTSQLLSDELDWLDAALEQFADAWRQVTRAETMNLPLSRRAAEGIYLHVYLGIQLSERFVERIRMKAADSGK